MSRGFTPATSPYGVEISSPQTAVSMPGIGKFKTVTGSVTVTRANIIAQAIVGDSIYCGDVIETSDDGSVTLTFRDGTRFHLYASTRMVVDEFVCGAERSSGSALIRIVKGMFAVVAGKLASAGRLIIDTPLGQIRARGPAAGIGSLALGILTFNLIKELQAASGDPNAPDHLTINDNDLQQGKLTYAEGDLNDLEHGTFVIDTFDGKHYEVGDVTKTLWIHGGSSDYVTNTPAQLAALHNDYLGAKDVYNSFRTDPFFDQYRHAKADPTSNGSNGSGDPSTILGLNLGGNNNQFQQVVGIITAPHSGGSNEGGNGGTTQIILPPPFIQPGVTSTGSGVSEQPNITGSSTPDTAGGTLTFTDTNQTNSHTVSVAFVHSAWSNAIGPIPATTVGDATTALTASITTDTGGSGTVQLNFSFPDKDADFLAQGETLTLTYNVTVTNTSNGTTATAPVSVTVTGSNDAPVLNADIGTHTIPRSTLTDSASGTLTYTDVDLSDSHTVSQSAPVFVWSGGPLTVTQIAALTAESTLTLTDHDSTGSGSGSVDFAYSAADASFDFLAAGESLTITYNVAVTDSQGATSTQPVTFTIGGSNDAPVLNADTGTHTIPERTGLTGSTLTDSASGTLTYTDVNLSDSHTVSQSAPVFVWSGGALTATQIAALTAESTLTLTDHDSTGSGSGSVDFAYSAADASFDFLATGESLTITYNVTVTDSQGATSTQPVTFTVGGSNDAPVLNADTGTHAVPRSTLTDSASGTLTYTDVDLSDSHTVSQSAPVFVWSRGALTATQIAALTAESTLTPTNHDSTGSGSGSIGFTYSAADASFDFLAAGESLTITYNVTVTDSQGVTSTQPITFTVGGSNDAPVLNADTGTHTIPERTGLTGSTLTDSASGTLTYTDVNLSDSHTVSQSAPVFVWSRGALTATQIAALTAESTLTPTNHDSTGSGSGSIDFTYSAADASFDFLAAGESLTITYNITVTDSQGASSTQPVTFTVGGSNDAPVLNADTGTHAIPERTGLTGSTLTDSTSGTLTYTDVDLSDSHTVSQSAPVFVWSRGALTAPQIAALTAESTLTPTNHDSTGSGSGSIGFSYSAADASFDFLAAGESLTITYNVTVTDSQGATSTQPVTFTVGGSNDAPVLNADTGTHAVPRSTLTDSASGTLTYTDVDLSDSHTVSQSAPVFVWSRGALTATQIAALTAESTLTPTNHDSTGSGSGSIGFTYSAADASFDFLAAGESLTITYNVTVTDSQGVTSTQPITFTVGGSNDAPVLNADTGTHPIPERTGLTGSTLTDSASGTLTYTDVNLSDSHTVSQSAPVFVWSGGALTATQIAALTAESTLTPTNHDSTGSGSGSIGFTYSAADASFDFLAAGESLTITYNVTVTDSQGASSTQPVTFTVGGSNDAPVLNADTGTHAIPERTGLTGSTLTDSTSGTLTYTDVDLSDSHTVSQSAPVFVWSRGALTAPQIAALTAESTLTPTNHDSTGSGSGSIGFTYSAADASFDFLAAGESLTVTYNVTVTDSQGAISTQPVTFTVGGSNDAPVLNADTGTHAIPERTGLTGSTLTDSTSGTLTYTDVDLSDSHTVSQSAPVFVWSRGALTAPQIAALTAESTLTPTNHDSTGSGSGSIGFTYSAADASFDFLAAGESLTITYNVTVTDSQGATSTQPVTFTVGGSNDAPVLNADTGTHAVPRSTLTDSASGTLTYTDVDLSDSHTVSQSAPVFVWSRGALTATQIAALTAESTLTPTNHDSTGSGSGSIGFTYSAADASFDFLAAGESLTITYNVTVTDSQGVTSTQPITFTVGGSNDAPVLNADTGTHAIPERTGLTGSTLTDSASGTLTYTDVNLSDSHTVSQSAPVFVWSDGSLTAAQIAALTAGALTLTETDSTGTGSGSVAWTYSAQDQTFDFLAKGATLTITYNVTVTDNHGASSTQPVTITVTGSDDAPIVGGAGNTVNYTESNSPVTVDTNLTVTDPDIPTALARATVTISNFHSGDTLSANTAGTNITASFSSGVLTLSGSDTLAHYQQVLDGVAFSTTSADLTSRTVTWSVNDGILSSNTPTTTVTVSPPPISVTSVTYQTSNGTTEIDHSSGDSVLISVHFSGDVFVTGSPTLTLSIFSNAAGTTPELATYQSGSGTDTLVFFFTPSSSGSGQNDRTTDLGITAVNGTITGSGGNAVNTSGADVILSPHLGVNEPAAPAGVAGDPINLALTDQTIAPDGPIKVTFTGVPSDWRLNQGTNLGNGTWAVETNDLSALTVLTAAAYAGAVLFGVTETWTNANGTTGSVSFGDNVEAYAPGSPIFAWVGDDTLTGAGANDLFVFAQPIGNDVIYNFNVASDHIDLVGFDGVSSFTDVHLADDANGNAVVTLGSGETITLHGVDAGLLTASNFEFDRTPVTENAASMVISDGATLPLSGIIDNSGTIELNSTGDATELQIVGDGITLQGGGQIVMSDSDMNFIVGTSPTTVLTNVDNTISGVGQIGTGDGNLTLVNEAAGTIDANVAGGILVLDTGNTIVNYGVLEASNGGTLQIQDAVTGGTALIAGGTIEFDAAASLAVTFDNGAGGTTYGALILIDPSHFDGSISGFTGTAADLAHSDGIDVVGIDFNSAQFSDSYDSSTGLLTVSDGTDTASLKFDGFNGDIQNFHFAEDAKGTGTLITDPPGLEKSATVSLISSDTTDSGMTAQASNSNLSTTNTTTELGPNASATVGADGDHLVFTPGIGAETVTNFNAQQDTIELDQFANAQTVQELQSLVTTDAHGDALINLGHNDSITLPGVTAAELQQIAQAGHILLH